MKNNRDFSEDLMTVLMVSEKVPSNMQFPVLLDKESEEEDIAQFIDSQRANNALHRSSIFTAKQLMNAFDKLDNIRNLGSKSVKEVKNSFMNWYYSSLDDNKVKEFWSDFVTMNNITAIAR